MSFLDKIFSGDITAEDPRRFIIEAMLAAMEADSDVTEDEMDTFERNLEEHELFSSLNSEERSRLIDVAADAIRDAGGGQLRIDAMAHGLPSRAHRLAAYAMAAEVCVSDADLPDAEIAYLDALKQALALSDEEATALFDAARQRSGLKTVEERAAAMRKLMPRFIDCMALLAHADGKVRKQEVAGVRAVLRKIPDMAVLTHEELDEAIEESFTRVDRVDVASALDQIADVIRDPADRYWTTVYMMIVGRADGKSDWREVECLEQAKKSFALTDAQMEQASETASLFPGVLLGGAAPAK
ncbi:MAG TPA: TerB family tellurite resistance protein [Kofleriaceae bacterium]|nr:TerB family tellurite resistance protein [Kofleriaceae bacterium]